MFYYKKNEIRYMKHKRFFVLLLAVIIISGGAESKYFAQAADSQREAVVLRYATINLFRTELYIVEGKADWHVRVNAKSGTTKIEADVTLQKLSTSGSVLEETHWNDNIVYQSYMDISDNTL